jgi:hypothetical protein
MVFIEMIADLLPLARRIALERILITRAQGNLTLFFDHLLEPGWHPSDSSCHQRKNPNTSADHSEREVSPRIPG